MEIPCLWCGFCVRVKKVRVAAWRQSGARPPQALRLGLVAAAAKQRGAENGEDGGEAKRAAEGNSGLGGGGGGPLRASVVVVGGVCVTAAMARLKGLDLDALAQRFDRSTRSSLSVGAHREAPGEDARCRSGKGDTHASAGVARGAGERGWANDASSRSRLSQAFAKLSDAQHCIFKPRSKSPARRAAAKAAGFGGKGDDQDNGPVDGGFRPNGGGPTRAELEVRVEQVSKFFF